MDEKELKTPVNVGVTISTEDAVIEGAELCVLRAAQIAVTDDEHGWAKVHAILTDNDQKDHVITFPSHRIGRLLQAAGVRTFAEIEGRLVYAGDLTNTKPVVVNPFTFAAVRGELVPVPEPEKQEEDSHEHGA
jgi:hypothetical protein